MVAATLRGYHRPPMSTAYSIGHSTRSAAGLIEVLHCHGVQRVADIRRWPASRRMPHFNEPALRAALEAASIDYVWLGKGLGGYRKELLPVKDSPNTAWEVDGFRHYADYLDTAEGQAAMRGLEDLCRERPTAFLCAERHWSKCHRQLVANAMLARGWELWDILDAEHRERHALPGFAHIAQGRLSYPGQRLLF